VVSRVRVWEMKLVTWYIRGFSGFQKRKEV